MNEVILELAKVGDLQEIEDQTLAHVPSCFSRMSRELYRAQMITKAGGPEALEWIELPLEERGPGQLPFRIRAARRTSFLGTSSDQ